MPRSSRRSSFAMATTAERLGMHPQTLRKYERAGLIDPRRQNGYHRSYSDEDIERLAALRHLALTEGVNIAGLRVVVRAGHAVRALEAALVRERIRSRRLAQALAEVRRALYLDTSTYHRRGDA